MNYEEFLNPNHYTAFANAYVFERYMQRNALSTNLFKILKKRKMKKILKKWYHDILNLKCINECLMCDFMGFINLNQDVFSKPGFEYMDLENEDVLKIKIQNFKYEDYELPDYIADTDVLFVVNRRTKTIRIKTMIKDMLYNREFKDKVIYPDNVVNKDIFKVVLSIIYCCTRAYVEGDDDAITELFRIDKQYE